MEIYHHYYPGYGSVEEQFQKRYGKKRIDTSLKPLSQKDKEEIEKMDVLRAFDNPDNKPVY